MISNARLICYHPMGFSARHSIKGIAFIYIYIYLSFQGLFKANFRYFALYFLHVVVFEILAYLTLYYFGSGWIPFVISLLFYGTFQVSMISIKNTQCVRVSYICIPEKESKLRKRLKSILFLLTVQKLIFTSNVLSISKRFLFHVNKGIYLRHRLP